MTYPTGFHIFSGPDDSITLDEAKKYIADHKLSSDDVRIVRYNGTVSVVCKREVALHG